MPALLDHLPHWAPTAAGIALIAFGLLSTAWAIIGDVRRALASRHWPDAEGLIIASTLDVSGSSDERFEKHTIAYRYEVDGRDYTGRRVTAGGNFDITLGGSDNSWSSAGDRQQRYPAGTPVRVLYNPTNPKDCCLEPGGLLCAILEVIVSLAIVWLGIYLLQR